MYVFLVLGQSPALLTELLWWLHRVERSSIAGIEAWCTSSAAEHLDGFLERPVWKAFQDATQLLPGRDPDGTPPDCTHGFRVHIFDADGTPLWDVRSAADAEAVNARLHDRLRALRRDLRDRTPILACLAGGRKSVSAALQTAFTMQAGPTDRLVHVLLHEDLEVYLRSQADGRAYVYPTDAWAERSGVPVDEQVVVHDLPVPRLRSLVPEQLARVLAEQDWKEVWPELKRNAGRPARALLRRVGTTWHYSVRDGDQLLAERTLANRPGSLLAAMSSVAPGATTADIIAWLDARDVDEGFWTPPPSADALDQESRPRAVRGAAHQLRKKLAGLPTGLERFSPDRQTYALADVDVVLDTTSGQPS